jgi:hypothetical protein
VADETLAFGVHSMRIVAVTAAETLDGERRIIRTITDDPRWLSGPPSVVEELVFENQLPWFLPY